MTGDNNPSTRRCLLTGAGGYVGSRIARRLRADGWQVTALSRQPSHDVEQTIPFKLGDPTDPDKLRGFDALIHAAYDQRVITWSEIETVNVRGSQSLLGAAHQAGVRNIVFISTISAFDGCKSLYGKGKLAVEATAREFGAWI
ncbi:MAG: NAD(P)-dependent oxidoreductase, partial [Alphaproteobacteria bacterium]